MSFALSTVDVGINWLKKLDQLVRTNVRNWHSQPAGSPNGLYHSPNSMGGLGIPSFTAVSTSRRTTTAIRILTDKSELLRKIARASFSLFVKKTRSLLQLIPEHRLSFPSLLKPTQSSDLTVNSITDWRKVQEYVIEYTAGDIKHVKLCIWNSSIKWRLWSSVFDTLQRNGLELEYSRDHRGRSSMHLIRSKDQSHLPRNALSRVLSATENAAWKQEWHDLLKCGSSLRCIEKENAKPKGDFHPASFACLRNPYLLTDREYSFVLKARTELLPVGTNLNQWYPDTSPYCPKPCCRRKKDSGNHRLNSCKANLPLFRKRHDAIASVTYSYCDPSLQKLCDPSEYSLLWDETTPPEHYTTGSSLRPDIQEIAGPKERAALLDFKVPYHGQSFLQCHDKNVAKYQHLANKLSANGFKKVILDTIIVSSDGLIPQHTADLLKLLPIPPKQIPSLLKMLSITAIKESCRIFDGG